MNTTVISVKVDKETKAAAQEVAKAMGIPLSTLINAYLKKVVITRRAEFFAPEEMTPHLEKLLAPIMADIEAGRKRSQKFNSAEAAIAWLKKQ